MADGEPQSLCDFTFLSGLFRKSRGGFARWSFWRERMSVSDLLWLKDKFQVLDQFLILSRSAESEAAAACLSQG